MDDFGGDVEDCEEQVALAAEFGSLWEIAAFDRRVGTAHQRPVALPRLVALLGIRVELHFRAGAILSDEVEAVAFVG